MYRRSEGQGWVDVSDQAFRDDMRHNQPTPTKELFVDWNMPSLKSDADKIRDIEGPGLMWGFALFIVRDIHYSYLKDQTLGIKSPYLRMLASTKQQAFRALDETNQKLEEFALTSIVPEIPGAVSGLGRAVSAVPKLAKVGAELEEAPKRRSLSTAASIIPRSTSPPSRRDLFGRIGAGGSSGSHPRARWNTIPARAEP